MKTHAEIFSHIYDKNIWGGSGGGSSPENTVEYRALLQNFLKEKTIKTVFDFGCGDWGFSHLMDWSSVEYFGIDCVNSVIQKNHTKYSSPNIHFYLYHENVGMGGDLLILKDVLQHWSNADIVSFLDKNATRFNYILITNTQSQSFDNEDIETGQTRGLSVKFEPLKKYNPEILAVIQTTIRSEVSLISNV